MAKTAPSLHAPCGILQDVHAVAGDSLLPNHGGRLACLQERHPHTLGVSAGFSCAFVHDVLLPSVWQLVWLTSNLLSCPCRMGNVALGALDDVHFHRDEWGAQMDLTPSFQYAYRNIPGALFNGYAWSLDTFVDYTGRTSQTCQSSSSCCWWWR